MIYILHKMLAFLKDHLNYLKAVLFLNAFLRSVIDLFFVFCFLFFITYNNGNFKSWRRKHKGIRNLVRLEKVTEAIKGRILRDVKNLFEHEEKKIIVNQ